MGINVNDMLEGSEISPLDKETSNTLYGFNTKGELPSLQKNDDMRGLVFFTRPQLNLTTTNIEPIRSFYPLLNKNEKSIQRFVRTTLDPRLLTGVENDPVGYYKDIKITCPLVDPENAFIPVLSNTLLSLTGWPDMVTPTFSTSAGMRKEQITMVDGTFEIYDAFDLSATFQNFKGEPLTLLFQIWMMYPSLVFEGLMKKYIDFIIENEFDYNTRIYRFVLDSSGRRIKKAAATGASFPNTSPTGKFFDFDRSKPFSDATGDINVTFKCNGALYFDDIVLKEFNATQAIFNPSIRKYLNASTEEEKKNTGMVKIPYEILPELNYRAYPIVDLDTYELIWLANKNSKAYKRLTEKLKKEKVNENNRRRKK